MARRLAIIIEDDAGAHVTIVPLDVALASHLRLSDEVGIVIPVVGRKTGHQLRTLRIHIPMIGHPASDIRLE